MRRMIALVCLALVATASSRADETSVHRQIVQTIQREQRGAIELLERVVNINSGTLNFEGVRAVADVFRSEFEPLGFVAQWVDGAGFGRAGHLVLRREGRGPRILLIGHMDTVFDRNHPFQRFERVDEHIVRGPGTADMKGGVVVALTALRALRDLNALDQLNLTIVLHGDEENAGEPLTAARAALIAAAKQADVALGLENAADNPRTAVVARRSSSHWHLEVQAKTAHSSRIFSERVGAGASYEVARVLNGFYTALQGERDLTFNAGVVLSGSQLDFDAAAMRGTAGGKPNIVSDRAVALGDLRALTSQQLESAVKAMQAIAENSLPQTRSTLTFTHNYPPMAPTEGNRRLLAMYDSVSRALGHGEVTAVDPGQAGAADISFASAHVAMNLDGLGLLGGKAHTAEEFADLRNFPIQAQRLALLLYRLAHETQASTADQP